MVAHAKRFTTDQKVQSERHAAAAEANSTRSASLNDFAYAAVRGVTRQSRAISPAQQRMPKAVAQQVPQIDTGSFMLQHAKHANAIADKSLTPKSPTPTPKSAPPDSFAYAAIKNVTRESRAISPAQSRFSMKSHQTPPMISTDSFMLMHAKRASADGPRSRPASVGAAPWSSSPQGVDASSYMIMHATKLSREGYCGIDGPVGGPKASSSPFHAGAHSGAELGGYASPPSRMLPVATAAKRQHCTEDWISKQPALHRVQWSG
jgi:hypothetical protein